MTARAFRLDAGPVQYERVLPDPDTLPSDAEQHERWAAAKARYDLDLQAWRAGGRMGPPPPRPVAPHIPGFVAPENHYTASDGPLP